MIFGTLNFIIFRYFGSEGSTVILQRETQLLNYMKIGIKRFLPLSLWAIMAFQLTAQNDTLPPAHSKHPRREVTLGEVTVMANGVGRVKQSAFNTVAISTREMQNTTKNLSVAARGHGEGHP